MRAGVLMGVLMSSSGYLKTNSSGLRLFLFRRRVVSCVLLHHHKKSRRKLQLNSKVILQERWCECLMSLTGSVRSFFTEIPQLRIVSMHV